MKKITEDETLEIMGGLNFNGPFLTALYRAGQTIMDAGRALGSAIRRLSSKNICPGR